MSSLSRRIFLIVVTLFATTGVLAAPKKKLSILILDGLGPVGAYQARYALSRGHSVTVFNRGQRDPDIPKQAAYLDGSRNGDYALLKDRKFDVVIDNAAASQPKWVTNVAPHVASAKQYIFLSDEIGEAEEAVIEAFQERATVVRAGAIGGPGDKTDRFTYWPVRIAGSGEVLAPGSPSGVAAFIDVRDLAEWMIRLAETRTLGTFDAVSKLTMGELLEGIRVATHSTAKFTWVSAEFLKEHSARLPVWSTRPFDPKGAIEHGLTYRPLADTVDATIAWHLTRDANRQAALRAGLAREREKELLAKWKERQ
ncbi:MAG TPA: epimerase [Thermoanaerobaculia bacterium]